LKSLSSDVAANGYEKFVRYAVQHCDFREDRLKETDVFLMGVNDVIFACVCVCVS